jgi:hypothetical protein
MVGLYFGLDARKKYFLGEEDYIAGCALWLEALVCLAYDSVWMREKNFWSIRITVESKH